MTGRKRSKRGNPHPLIIEPHPTDYNGYPFITLIQYRKEHSLTIVDNADDKAIKVYVLDMCGPAQVNEELLITVAHDWYETEEYTRYPVSIAFSRAGVAPEAMKIYRSFNIEFVTRVIGPLPSFEMKKVRSVKRRRRKPIPPGVQVIKNKKVEL
jgi:hypothetical protein